jgi:hypothetical protein
VRGKRSAASRDSQRLPLAVACKTNEFCTNMWDPLRRCNIQSVRIAMRRKSLHRSTKGAWSKGVVQN